MSLTTFAKKLIDKDHFPLWGIGGSFVGLIFILGAQIPYVGSEGEPFSMLNHFVSELGEIGVSEFALLFNVGMMLAGILFIPFMAGLAIYINNVVGKLAGVVGVYSAVSIFFVGVFPMNFMEAHTAAAMSFFLSGMTMTGLWAISIPLQKEARVPKVLSLGGIVNVIIFALFLYGPWGIFDLTARPDFSMRITLEWAIYFAIISYLLVLAISVWKKEFRGVEEQGNL